MNTHRHRLTLGLLLLVVLVAIAGWSWYRMNGYRQDARVAVADLAECQRLAAQIQSLRQRPNRAGAAEVQINELANAIESAADTASLPRQNLIRIWPENARRIGETPYKTKPTQVLIRGATLEQLTRFLHAIENHDYQLQVVSVRLTAPRDQDATNLWTAETTISYLIYDPPPQSGMRGASVAQSDN